MAQSREEILADFQSTTGLNIEDSIHFLDQYGWKLDDVVQDYFTEYALRGGSNSNGQPTYDLVTNDLTDSAVLSESNRKHEIEENDRYYAELLQAFEDESNGGSRGENQKVNALSSQEASAAIAKAWKKLQREQLATRKEELEKSCLTVRGKTIRWNECTYGEKTQAGNYSLWISMHGGGGCPATVNDEQYENQITLYKPTEGIWVVPRGPTDNWNLWHEEHIDPMFDRIIENYIIVKGINPNRVYILGYSAGGDGVYQLAPRMADRFAAAAMMAGHPNNASPLGLRNLPFAMFVGSEDCAYNRNEVAPRVEKRLDDLEKSDPGAYRHWVNICTDMGHWMCGRDAEALPWMAKWTRDPWPKKIVWLQSEVIHDRFYWLSLLDPTRAKPGQTIIAQVTGQTIHISVSDGIQQLTLRLSDALLDLNQPINVHVEGYGQVFQGRVLRTEQAIDDSLRRRADPTSVATALLELKWINCLEMIVNSEAENSFPTKLFSNLHLYTYDTLH